MRTAFTLCVLTLVLAACGAAPSDSTEEFGGAERAVAAAVESLESAARDDDADAVCRRLLSEDLLKALKEQGTTCSTAVGEAFEDADSFDLTVDDVTISGEKATAKVTSGSGSREKQDTLELEKSGSAWRIASLRA